MSETPKKEPNLSIDTALIEAVKKTPAEIARAMLWGEETDIEHLNLPILLQWFTEQKARLADTVMGALYKNTDLTSVIRIYQGVFNDKLECLVARQLLAQEIDQEVQLLFQENDLVVFRNPNIGEGTSS